jgi:hypothetical protein
MTEERTSLHPDLGALLEQAHFRGLAQRAKPRGPAGRNQSSAIGWPCPSDCRYLVLLRTVQPDPVSTTLQAIFEEGNAQEKVIDFTLVRDGWQVIETEHPNKVWQDLQISGRIDREVLLPREVAESCGLDPARRLIAEFKTMSGPAFEKATSLEAMLYARTPWTRGYVVQLLMYLWLESRPIGVFVLKDKGTGAYRFLPIHMDDWMGVAADAVEKCKRANQHLADGTLPPVLGHEDAVCSRCRVRNHCLPGEAGPGVDVLLDADMEEYLAEREALAEARKKYETLDAEVKARMKALAGDGEGTWIAGDWELRVTRRLTHYKAQPERDLTTVTVGIRRAKGETGNVAED